ncbi:MAG: bifunctional 2-polyprenyl-6-hydroxyphenol methylase/3-demethylubiquinol 3-O-methyltransferase UbiG [Burkholderiales bacterium]
MTINADPIEVEKFSQLAHRWWDPHGEFKPLHDINPLRLNYIDRIAGLRGKNVLDVGCGGGILAESMAARGATVTGIDLSAKALKVAQLHLLESRIPVNYREVATEVLAEESPGQFDIVTCMELLEHVPDPASTVASCAALLKPGGQCFFSTINRNLKAYLMAVVGAEYILGLLPKGTHDYARFITPSELGGFCRRTRLDPMEVTGMSYNPISRAYSLGRDASVNYIISARKN